MSEHTVIPTDPVALRVHILQTVLTQDDLCSVFATILSIAKEAPSNRDKIAASKLLIEYVWGKSPHTVQVTGLPTSSASNPTAGLSKAAVSELLSAASIKLMSPLDHSFN